MMWGWNWNIGWGMWLVMALFQVIFWGAIAVVIVSLVRRSGWSSGAVPPRSESRSSALTILEERFARGEIDQEEFERRRAVLRG